MFLETRGETAAHWSKPVMRFMLGVVVGVAACGVSMQALNSTSQPATTTPAQPAPPATEKPMRLGNFSMSLAVKDLAASRAFYEKLGFRVVAGNGKNYSILQNDSSTIGLFQGIIPKNSLTYNPGWDRTCATLPDFDDVRDLQKRLKAQGLTLMTIADENSTGPASFTIMDPDGNPILVDQHVPKPAK
jgi:catechol 2,3-dioxygenase-like lactoylglutathione lyase family enzyme